MSGGAMISCMASGSQASVRPHTLSHTHSFTRTLTHPGGDGRTTTGSISVEGPENSPPTLTTPTTCSDGDHFCGTKKWPLSERIQRFYNHARDDYCSCASRTTSLPFVHTAGRSFRLSDLMSNSALICSALRSTCFEIQCGRWMERAQFAPDHNSSL